MLGKCHSAKHTGSVGCITLKNTHNISARFQRMCNKWIGFVLLRDVDSAICCDCIVGTQFSRCSTSGWHLIVLLQSSDWFAMCSDVTLSSTFFLLASDNGTLQIPLELNFPVNLSRCACLSPSPDGRAFLYTWFLCYRVSGQNILLKALSRDMGT